MMERVRVGIIGAGKVVRNRHLPALQKIPGVEVRQIWSRNPHKADEMATKFGIPVVVNRWQEIADAPDLDAVVVATPPILHLPATVAALEAGKHVLCQARMARNLREAQTMLHAARASNLVTALYPPRPGLKGDRVMRRLLHEEGFVGDIREVRVTGFELMAEDQRYIWRDDPDVVGVNAMRLGMWVEVLNRWVGPAIRVAAVGKCHRQRRRNLAGEWVEAVVPDSLAVAAELECGATASYHMSNCVASGPGHLIEIYGSTGTLVYQLFAEEIRGANAGIEELQPIEIPPGEERLHSTDAEFIRAIREGTQVSPDFEEGLRYMEFLEATALSLESGTAVSVPPSQAAMDTWGEFLDQSDGNDADKIGL
jgi:predicted dehydrogenase